MYRPSDIQHSAAYSDLRVFQWHQSLVIVKPRTSDVKYTSVYTESEPGRDFWEADMRGYRRADTTENLQIIPVPQGMRMARPMFIQAHDPNYVPEPIYPEYIPLEDDHEFPAEEQPLPPIDFNPDESPGLTLLSRIREYYFRPHEFHIPSKEAEVLRDSGHDVPFSITTHLTITYPLQGERLLALTPTSLPPQYLISSTIHHLLIVGCVIPESEQHSHAEVCICPYNAPDMRSERSSTASTCQWFKGIELWLLSARWTVLDGGGGNGLLLPARLGSFDRIGQANFGASGPHRDHVQTDVDKHIEETDRRRSRTDGRESPSHQEIGGRVYEAFMQVSWLALREQRRTDGQSGTRRHSVPDNQEGSGTRQLANDLMDRKSSPWLKGNLDNQRKDDGSSRNKPMDTISKPFKNGSNVARSYNMGTGERKHMGDLNCPNVRVLVTPIVAITRWAMVQLPKRGTVVLVWSTGHFKRDVQKLKNKNEEYGMAQGWGLCMVGKCMRRGEGRCAAPVAGLPYRLAPSEMMNYQNLNQELSDKVDDDKLIRKDIKLIGRKANENVQLIKQKLCSATINSGFT
ncbi:hypothetical protein Tco_1057328 [Tanacetum coccineum]|uniref:Uncharacterized protein n=1 Tax=Tanacetum coccineum TaxID=301880 RepID=A0ABQ5H566_9ASTR